MRSLTPVAPFTATSPARSRTAVRAGAPPARAAARLELLELFLTMRDQPDACAQAALDWLARHASLRRSLCLLLDGETETLVAAAAVGVSGDLRRDGRWRLTLHDPLSVALRATGPTLLRGRGHNGHAARASSTPLGTGPVVAVPLRSGGDDRDASLASGLLLVRTTAATDDLRWVGDVLGQQLDRVQERRSAARDAGRLRRERALFLTIINAVPDPILLTDPDGRLIVANAPAERLFASTEEESEGRRRAVELNNMLFSAALSRSAFERPAEPRELLLVDPGDGSDRLFELLSLQVEDPREGTGLVSVLRNVTDLRRAMEQIEENYQRMREAEAATRAERDRLDLIIDSVADPILVTDENGAIMLMNAPAEELFTAPLDAEAAAQRSVQSNDASFSSFIAGLLVGEHGHGAVRRGEITLTHPETGAPIPVEAIAGQVLTGSGELTAVVTILHDRREALERARLYEQVKAASDELQGRVQAATAELATQNELLRRQALELEQASRLKSQFLANMSHEFRTPLNAILGYTHMLLQGVAGTLPPGACRQLQRIDSNGRHLLTIINEILDITRIEAGRMPVQMSEFEVGALVREVLAELDAVVARSRLAVGATLVPRRLVLVSDRQKVKQIVVNLLSNALKFTPAGRVDVAVRVDRAARMASIAVRDTGIGIPPEHHERIFEDFRQLDDSPSRAYGGTGLGLAICRRLAEAIQATITLESQPGDGSTFTLRIPLDQSQ